MTFKDYINFKSNFGDKNSTVIASKNTCFQNWSTCIGHMSGGQNPGDDVICEWIPCVSFAYVACFIMAQEGFIEEGYDCFIGCQACDVYIDAP
ncbi:hypothetical protein [uncultured Winogradskyella sp.]|uniref:hypothetical protein n=1 Tax=uncultured Winogradskyella sp. TaxID=395353 RepID=UPI0030D89A86|tara:strand:+ start:83766 stop:84044 length:279 start_codon:yes stop_codon:yes gene_type:complete